MIDKVVFLILTIALAGLLFCVVRIIQIEIGSRRRMKKIDEWYQEEMKWLEGEKERIREMEEGGTE